MIGRGNVMEIVSLILFNLWKLTLAVSTSIAENNAMTGRYKRCPMKGAVRQVLTCQTGSCVTI